MAREYSESKLLYLEKDGPVTTLVLNRPDQLNALSVQLSDDFNKAAKQIDQDRECRVLIIKGAGDNFCTGDDLKDHSDKFFSGDEAWPEGIRWQVRQYQETIKIIENLVPVTIAQVDGICCGGGLEITLGCDFVVATDRSTWGMPEINWDLTPGWGGTAKIAKFAGRRKAKEWNLLGALFSAKTAEKHNLVNRLVAPEQLEAEVAQLVEIILDKDPIAMHCTKYCLDEGADLPYSSVMAFEGAAQRADVRKGLKEFGTTEGRNHRRRLLKGFWWED